MQSLWTWLASLGPWNWFILGVALFLLEGMVPGVHFVWFGLAAVIVCGLALATDITWQWQVIAFGVISVLTVFWVRKFYRAEAAQAELSDLNVRGQQYVGRAFVVEQAIQNGRGKIRVGDSLWQAEGPDAPAGARVKVTGTKGTVLVVQREQS